VPEQQGCVTAQKRGQPDSIERVRKSQHELKYIRHETVPILTQSTLPLIGMLVTSLGWSIEYHTHSDMRLCAHNHATQ
jgi:hypothetical protein